MQILIGFQTLNGRDGTVAVLHLVTPCNEVKSSLGLFVGEQVSFEYLEKGAYEFENFSCLSDVLYCGLDILYDPVLTKGRVIIRKVSDQRYCLKGVV